MDKVNDFKTDLEHSHDEETNKAFDAFYMSYFPMAESVEFITDLEMQKMGIDKIIRLSNRGRITIDEKVRRTDYDDILIEYWSNFEEKKLGWIYYSRCDFIMYANNKNFYMLPFRLMQLAWKRHSTEWRKKYNLPPAKNNGYETHNVAVPIKVLLDAIRDEMIHTMTEVRK